MARDVMGSQPTLGSDCVKLGLSEVRGNTSSDRNNPKGGAKTSEVCKLGSGPHRGLAGVINKADDILVFGSGDSIEEVEEDHDINLWNLMLRCREVNLKLNPKKFNSK